MELKTVDCTVHIIWITMDKLCLYLMNFSRVFTLRIYEHFFRPKTGEDFPQKMRNFFMPSDQSRKMDSHVKFSLNWSYIAKETLCIHGTHTHALDCILNCGNGWGAQQQQCTWNDSRATSETILAETRSLRSVLMLEKHLSTKEHPSTFLRHIDYWAA